MNAKLDKMTKSAKSQRRRLSAATEENTIVGKIRDERSQSKQEEVSVWGPYRDGPTRFRLKISEKGEVRNVCYKTREDAESVKANLLAQAEDRQECTVGAAVTAFCQYLEETRCIKEDSVRGAAHKLAWLPADSLLVSIKPEQAERLYRELVHSVNPRNKKPPSTATQRARLTTARYFFSWAQKSGLCRQNPFAGVQPIGRMNVGKKQLRIDEARRFEAVCLKQAESGDTAAFGALLMIYLGLRQSEVAARVKRDIDDEGRVLWIPSGKTKNAKRRLKIPEHLRPLLLTLLTEKESEDRLFYPPNRKRSSGYYWAHVRRLCRLADVPVICPHSLRGLHATLALEGGATADSVAKALGHGSFAMTARHYATESSVLDAQSSRVSSALAAHPDSQIEWARLLKGLPAERLPELFVYLRTQCSAVQQLDDKPQT